MRSRDAGACDLDGIVVKMSACGLMNVWDSDARLAEVLEELLDALELRGVEFARVHGRIRVSTVPDFELNNCCPEMSRIYDRKVWRRVRLVVLNRDNWSCRCGKTGGAMEVHHKVRGGGVDPYDPEGLETVCRTCHFAVTADERAAPASRAWDVFVDEGMGRKGHKAARKLARKGEIDVGLFHELKAEVRAELSRVLGKEWTRLQPAVDAALDAAVKRALVKLAGQPSWQDLTNGKYVVQERYIGNLASPGHRWRTIASRQNIMDADKLVDRQRDDAAYQLRYGPFRYRIVYEEKS